MADGHPPVSIPCPLCEQPTRVIDEPALPDWLQFEGCACDGFGIWADLVATGRLAGLTAVHRGRLQARIRSLRGSSQAAWLDTDDGLLSGRLTVSPQRAHRSSGPPVGTCAACRQAVVGWNVTSWRGHLYHGSCASMLVRQNSRMLRLVAQVTRILAARIRSRSE